MNERLLFLIDKKGTQIDNFYEIISNNIEMPINQIKKKGVASSSFYVTLKKDINKLNSTLEELKEEKAFDYSSVKKNGRNLITIKRNQDLQIFNMTYHFVLQLERETPNGEQNNSGQ